MTKPIADDFEAIAKQLSRKAPAATAEPAALTREVAADPLVALAEQIAAAEERHHATWDAFWEAERQTGLLRAAPSMVVGYHKCWDAKDVRRAAIEAKFSPERVDELANLMLCRIAEYRQQREAAGLVPFEKEKDAAYAEWDRLMEMLAHTPANTMAGLVVKLRRVALEAEEGLSNYGEDLAKSALADAERLLRA